MYSELPISVGVSVPPSSPPPPPPRLFGTAPFKGAQPVHTVAQIMDAQPNLDGQLISAEAQDFLEQLLKRHPG